MEAIKKILFLSLFLLSSYSVGDISKESVPDPLPSEIGTPNWIIRSDAPNTIISANSVKTPRWFYITNRNALVSKEIVKLTVDGVLFDKPINSEGGALVYGTSISVSHANATKVDSVGNWLILNSDTIKSKSYLWRVNQAGNAFSLIAKFDAAREFQLSFTTPDPTNSCKKGQMIVYVDNKELEPLNTRFQMGSTLIGKGTTVSVKATGDCPEYSGFYGTIQILN